MSVELFLENLSPERLSVFDSFCEGPHYVLTVRTKARNLSAFTSRTYRTLDDLLLDKKGWIRVFYELTRYGNTGVMRPEIDHHVRLNTVSVPSDFFPPTEQSWP